MLTTFSLLAATAVDVIDEGWEEAQLDFAPIMLVVFGVGALNTSFVKDGEVSIPLSYVTGTLVKMGQGIERHIAGGKAADWLGYFLLFASFVLGGAVGGCISVVVNGTWMLVVASVMCALTTGYHVLPSGSPRRVGLARPKEASAAALAVALLPMLAWCFRLRLGA